MINVLETLKKYSNDSNNYGIVLICGSLVCIVIYGFRYSKVSQLLPRKHSDDLKSLTIVVISLCIWNIAMVTFTNNILLNLDGGIRYLNTETNLPKSFRGYFINENIHSVLNMHYLKKDLKILVLTIVSLVLFKVFSTVILKTVEYISFISDLDVRDVEKAVPRSPVSKSVSFNSNLTTFQYLDMELSVSKSRLSLGQSSLWSLFIKRCISFFIVLVISYCIIPDTFLFNSSAIILQYSSITLKSDHLFYAIFTMFVLDVVVSSVKVANHPKIKNFPQFTSILSRFIWCYGSFIVAISMSSMVLFNDLLINLVKFVAIYSSNLTHASSYYPILFVTQIFIDYLTHSVQHPCMSSTECSQVELVNALSENFIWLKNTLSSCCIVLNLSSFVIFPMLIWLVVIESKLGRGTI